MNKRTNKKSMNERTNKQLNERTNNQTKMKEQMSINE